MMLVGWFSVFRNNIRTRLAGILDRMLLWACFEGYFPMARILLCLGADPRTAEAGTGATALMAISRVSPNVALASSLLVHRADPLACDMHNLTAADFALMRGHAAVAEVILASVGAV